MENHNTQAEDNIDLVAVLDKIKAYWYLFAISILLFLVLAFVYLKFAESNYSVSSTIMFDKIETGSALPDEMMESDNYRKPENNLIVSNQVSILRSDELLNEVVDSLNHTVSYYSVESFWPGFLEESWLNEQYSNSPFEVIVDKSANQLVGLLIEIEYLGDNQIKIEAEGNEVRLYNFAKDATINQIEKISIDETVTLGQPFVSDYLNITVKERTGFSEPSLEGLDHFFKIRPDAAIVKQMAANLTLELSEKITEDSREQPRVLHLAVESNVPRKGMEFMDKLLQVYQRRNLTRKNDKGFMSIDFLDQKIAVVADSLKNAEQMLETFKTSSSLIDVDAARSNIYTSLGELERERATIQNQLSYYRSTLSNIKNSKSGNISAPSTYGIDNDILNKLIEQYLQVSTRINELQYSVKAGNPVLQQLKQQLSDLQNAIAQNLNSAVAALNDQQRIVSGRIGSINSNISSLPKDERRLARLERNYEHYSTRYNYLVERKTEAQLSLDSNTPDFEVIQEAKLGDTPVWPNSNLVYSIAIVLAIIFPLGFVFFKEKTSDIVLGKDELERRTKAPLLGMIANGPSKLKIVNKEQPNSAIAESFKFARINLQYFHQDNNNKVIGLTSSISGEGKTFCAANLAAAFADSGQRTLLVCGDLRKPRINEYFKVKSTGLTDYVNGNLNFADAIQPTEIRNLDVIAPGQLQSDPVNMFESKQLDELFTEAKERYDRIIVETPPIGYVVDYFVLLKHFDINLFVVRYNFTKKNILDGINDLYNNKKIKNLYILFNDVKTSSNSYYGQIYGAKEYHDSSVGSKKLGSSKTKNPFS